MNISFSMAMKKLYIQEKKLMCVYIYLDGYNIHDLNKTQIPQILYSARILATHQV